MGADGSGRYTVISKSWDLADHAWTILNYLERSLYDVSRPMTAEFVDTAKAELRKLQDQLKAAIERERQK